MNPTQITNHEVLAKDRVVEQYKNKTNFQKLLKIFTERFNEIEQVGFDVLVNRWVDNAVGEQLDKFGTIVVLDRQGFDDTTYRRLLKVKIGINNSKGRPEDIIANAVLLFQAGLVHYQNLNNAEVAISVDVLIADADIQFFVNNLQKLPSAGVRINYIAQFDATEPFSLDGTQVAGLGLSSLAAPTTGGKLAQLRQLRTPFSLSSIAGDNDPSLGLGALADPWAGGAMIGL